MLGKNDRNIFYLRQIVASDPLDEEYLNYLAQVFEYSGQLESAAATWKSLSDLKPGRYHEAYAEVMLLANRPREALDALQKETDELERQTGLALAYWKLDHKFESDEALTRLEKAQRDRKDGWLAYRAAEVRAYRGEADAAFEWLDRAYAIKTPAMLIVVVDPLLRSLHGDPRFDAILHRLKLDG
jgi:predicted Zn-dependent protease